MSRLRKIARRSFLLGSIAITGGVAFGYWKYRQPYENPLLADLGEGEIALTPYITVSSDGITIHSPKSEMGQGVMTTVAAMVAEELDVELDQVTVAQAPAGYAYYNSAVAEEAAPFKPFDHSYLAETVRALTDVPAKMLLAIQNTGGSSSVPDPFVRMRKAGAAARLVFVEAAAQMTDVPADALKTANGHVITPDGHSIAYTDLVELAAQIEPTTNPDLKPQTEWRLLGKSLDRIDMVPKCVGTAEFGIDVRMEGMLHATIRLNPRIGGALNGFDASEAEQMRGVEKIVELPNGVAIIATNTWYAMEAARKIVFDWGAAPYPPDIESHYAALEEAFTEERRHSVRRDDGDVDAAMPADSPVWTYRAPYLAHATMEPMNATVRFSPERTDIWVGTQGQTKARELAANALGVAEETVIVHTKYLGGGFGRRGEQDMIVQAALMAKEMPGTPVKMTLSREEDMCQDFYRPAAVAKISGFAADGKIQALDANFAAPATAFDGMLRRGATPVGDDFTIVQAAWDQPYMPEAFRVTGYLADTMLPIGFWRAVGASQNAFFLESAIDEIAVEAGTDPVQLRLNSIEHETSRKVISAVADMADWGAALPTGRARGMAFSLSFGVPTAQIVEIEETSGGIKLRDVWAVADVGLALDPRNLDAQIISGVNFGLSAAILNEITLEDGAVAQTNFHSYDAIRMYQAPRIHTKILENGRNIRGIGEPGTPPAAPALANAIFALTGKRLREMPFRKFVNFV